MAISLITVMKEWGINRGGIDRQVSFAMKDPNKSSFKFIGNRFKKSNKETKNHQFAPHMYHTTTFCDSCKSLIWGIGYQGYVCQYCDLNIHKECLGQVESCKKKKTKKDKRLSLINPKKTPSTSSTDEVLRESLGDPEEDASTTHSVKALKERFEKGPSALDTQTSTTSELSTNSVSRSESFNKKPDRSKSSDPRRARSDVDKDSGDVLKAIDQSRSSSSASSLQSTRSDSSSAEKVNDLNVKASNLDDSDLDVEESMPSIDSILPKDVLRKMKPKEKKLQEVINELFYTEKSHLRNLKLLDELFHRPMASGEPRVRELADIVFPQLPALIKIHCELNSEMKKKMKENPLISVKDVSEMLLRRFDGEAGEKMKEVCASFCRNHTYALNVLKDRRKRDAKFQELMTAGENSPMCRRLQFKDLMIAEVHRLTKYPLLIDSMCKHTSAASEEHTLLSKTSRLTKDTLAFVNRAVKDCENHHKLVALQHRLDTRPIQGSTNPLVKDYKNLNLVEYKLVYEGTLTWRLSTSAKKQIDLHVVLLEEMLVLLQVQDDGKLVLKCQSQIASSVKDDSNFGHSPIITLNSMLVRQVATDKKAFFIINTSQLGPQIYDLVANSVEEKKRWFKYITEASENQKSSKSSNTIRRVPTPSYKSKLRIDDGIQTSEVKAESNDTSVSANNSMVDGLNPQPEALSYKEGDEADTSSHSSKSTAEMLNEKDEIIKRALVEKKKLVAGALNIPEQDYETVTEVAAEIEGERDPKSLVLASISDVMNLAQLLGTEISPTDAASPTLPTSSAAAAAAAPDTQSHNGGQQTAGVTQQQQISLITRLSKRLNYILDSLELKENERARLEMQLQTANQLLQEAPKYSGDSRPNSYVSNSSSASAGESDINASGITSPGSPGPATTPIASNLISTLQSTPDAGAHDSSSSTEYEDDSDDDGTVYADSKDEGNSEVAEAVKQTESSDSELSGLVNSHTDNAAATSIDQSADLAQSDSVISPSPSVSPDCDVDNNNTHCERIPNGLIDDKAAKPLADVDRRVIEQEAATQVEAAMTAAMAIMRQERYESMNRPDSVDHEDSSTLDCDTIDVDIPSDNELTQTDSPRGKVVDNEATNDIDDSDEGDALSASSLD